MPAATVIALQNGKVERVAKRQVERVAKRQVERVAKRQS
jgi:hypothetical protein